MKRGHDHPDFYDPDRDEQMTMVFAQWAIAMELRRIANHLEMEGE
jgi:hypothetical protein